MKQSTSYKKSTHLGFTMLEMMVVIVIVSLLSTVIFQAFQFTFNVYNKVAKQLYDLDATYLREQWFRQVNESIIREDDITSFIGSDNQFRAVTIVTLDGQIGVPTIVDWSLRAEKEGTSLWYQAGESKIKINYFASNQVEFAYLDETGVLQSRWPVDKKSLPLPKGIVLNVISQSVDVWSYIKIENTSYKTPSQKSWFE